MYSIMVQMKLPHWSDAASAPKVLHPSLQKTL